ncbi:MAG: DmsE family decaheme c-type cytochrome [Nitrospiraceae bacterium]|nr:DmsE family decaheme c-type cytochrome [Nitrospiraceae bacterium]
MGSGRENARSLLILLSGACLLFRLAAGAPAHAANAGGSSWQTYEKGAKSTGAGYVGSAECSRCHLTAAQHFGQTVHSFRNVGCESCHGPGAIHSQNPAKPINNFVNASSRVANGYCLRCHSRDTELENWAASSHVREGLRCVDCHKVHNSQAPVDLRKRRIERNESCTRCHAEEAAQENLPYHHPLREGKMLCTDCHNPHDGINGLNLRGRGWNNICYRCHPQYRGPYTYQHPPVTEDCMKCHTPHGSMYAGMVTVNPPYLCLQCHSGHHDGTSVPLLNNCTACHSSIHGSDVASATGGSRFVDEKGGFLPPSQTSLITHDESTARAVTDVYLYSSPAMAAALLPLSETLSSTSGGTKYQFRFVPTYRGVNYTGDGGRVGEYDPLRDAFGGDVALRVENRAKQVLMNIKGSMLSPDDYDVHGDLRVGPDFYYTLDAGSLVHNLDTMPYFADKTYFGVDPTITPPANPIAPGSVFGVTKTFFKNKALYHIPGTPLTAFMEANFQDRRGLQENDYIDEGCDTGTCHVNSELQYTNYETRDLAAGLTLKEGPATVTYKHNLRTARNLVAGPVDSFEGQLGLASAVPPGELPAGVPETPAGDYIHNIWPGYTENTDTLRMNLRWPKDVTFNAQFAYGRARDSFTDNAQDVYNIDANVDWAVTHRLDLAQDYHQQNTLNKFPLEAVPLFWENPDLHQLWTRTRADYKLTEMIGTEVYYRYSQTGRTNSGFWYPYEPYNLDGQGAVHSTDYLNTDLPYLVVPRTTANTAGVSVRLHQGTLWKARVGSEYTAADNPGYLTDPRVQWRVMASGSVSPVSWFSISEDAATTRQSGSPDIGGRKAWLLTSTTTLMLKPVPGWTLNAAYAYLMDRLETGLDYVNDSGIPVLYQQELVPLFAVTHEVSVSSILDLTKQLKWRVDFMYAYSHSRFEPSPAANPGDDAAAAAGYLDGLQYEAALTDAVATGADFSALNVPQISADMDFEYHWGHGLETGIQGMYASYRDIVHPEFNGYLRAITFWVGKAF